MVVERSFIIGIDHHKAPLSLREKLAEIKEHEILTSLQQHESFENQKHVNELMVLSTCNRYEIYGVLSDAAPCAGHVLEDIKNIIKQKSGVSAEILEDVSYQKHGTEMLRHGFNVASSLESMVLGEPQILGQMKNAYNIAKETDKFQGYMDKFCTQAFHVGKRVRSETELGKQPVSIASMAVKLAKNMFRHNILNAKVLIVGAGDMAIAASTHLKNLGVTNICVTNRSEQKGLQLAKKMNGEFQPFNQMEQNLADADIVITSTSSSNFIITKQMLNNAMLGRSDKPLFIVDIALPRDVEPEVNEIPNCFLCDIDTLGEMVAKNKSNRNEHINQANNIIEEELTAFMEWSDSRKNLHMVTHLRNHFETVRDEVLNRYEGEEVEQATRLLINKLLHKPSQALKSGDASSDEVCKILESLFPTGCTRQK